MGIHYSMRLHSHKKCCSCPLGSSSRSSSGMIETKKHTKFKGGNPGTRHGAAQCNTNTVYIFKCRQSRAAPLDLPGYFQADVEFALTFVADQCASGRLHSDHSATHAMVSKADLGGVVNPLVNGNCSFISTAMQPLDTFQTDTSDFIHRVPGVRRLDGSHVGRFCWREARSSTKFSHTDESAITDTLPNKELLFFFKFI